MKKLIAAFAVASIATAAYAAGPAFSEADADADGQVTMEEAKVALPDMEEAKIVAADVDGSGTLSEAEYTALTAG